MYHLLLIGGGCTCDCRWFSCRKQKRVTGTQITSTRWLAYHNLWTPSDCPIPYRNMGTGWVRKAQGARQSTTSETFQKDYGQSWYQSVRWKKKIALVYFCTFCTTERYKFKFIIDVLRSLIRIFVSWGHVIIVLN